MNVLAIQNALKAQGFDPGPLDGVWGRLTMAAVTAFQKTQNLEETGQVTPSVEDAILANAPATARATGLVWYDEATRLMGTQEVGGGGSNPVILDRAKDLDIAYKGDDVPWCGLFVSHCIGATLSQEPLPNNPLSARAWLKFGNPLQSPGLGAIMVFWRVSKDGGLGHVAFYAGEDADTFKVLGGNQSNKVSFARIAKNRLLQARWPRTVSLSAMGPILAGLGGGLSTNEQ